MQANNEINSKAFLINSFATQISRGERESRPTAACALWENDLILIISLLSVLI